MTACDAKGDISNIPCYHILRFILAVLRHTTRTSALHSYDLATTCKSSAILRLSLEMMKNLKNKVSSFSAKCMTHDTFSSISQNTVKFHEHQKNHLKQCIFTNDLCVRL
jgi:hypothetical protein